MHGARLLLPVLAAFAVSMLSGCGTVGPNSIKVGRNVYNDVIHQTSEEQLLLNLVRIKNHETPLFMEVSEIMAQVQLQATVSSGISGIGAHQGTTGGTLSGQVASVTGGTTYTEAPTIRYQPLQGAPLIAQLNSPIGIDSFVTMLNSGWTMGQLLPLIEDRLTPAYADYSNALIALSMLNDNKALVIEASQSAQTGSAGKSQNSKNTTTPAPAPTQTMNALTLFFEPEGLTDDNSNLKCLMGLPPTQPNIKRVSVRLWLVLLQAYRQPTSGVTDAVISSASSSELQKIISKLPNSIEIRGASSLSKNGKRSAPVLRTRSALGVMKRLAEEGFAAFVTPEKASSIMHTQPNKQGCTSPDYLYVIPDAPDVSNNLNHSKPRGIAAKLVRNFHAHSAWMLIQVADTPPADAFVSVFDNGSYYFITNEDEFSKRTLALLGLITSVQAIPDKGGGLTASVAVGAK